MEVALLFPPEPENISSLMLPVYETSWKGTELLIWKTAVPFFFLFLVFSMSVDKGMSFNIITSFGPVMLSPFILLRTLILEKQDL